MAKQKHLCESCNGRGIVGTLTQMGNTYEENTCKTCSGVGAVICDEKWVGDRLGSCSACNGYGWFYKTTEQYPSGKPAKQVKSSQCNTCSGTGKVVMERGHYKHINTRPDWDARK